MTQVGIQVLPAIYRSRGRTPDELANQKPVYKMYKDNFVTPACMDQHLDPPQRNPNNNLVTGYRAPILGFGPSLNRDPEEIKTK